MRAFTIEVDMVTGGAGLLRPGNRVDVILAAQTDPQKSRAFASQKNFDVARTLLHNLRVIAVDHTIETQGVLERIRKAPTREWYEAARRRISTARAP